MSCRGGVLYQARWICLTFKYVTRPKCRSNYLEKYELNENFNKLTIVKDCVGVPVSELTQ